MRGGILITVLVCLAHAGGMASYDLARAEETPKAEAGAPERGLPWETQPASGASETKPAPAAEQPPTTKPAPAVEAEPAADAKPASEPAPSLEPVPAEAAPPAAPPHPVVAIIRDKLAGSEIDKEADPEDVAALEAFYAAWSDPPLWITEMGFTARAQAALFEIEKADDWGLDAKDFALPEASLLPKDPAAQALAEIKLDLAILKYARFARGGRHNPLKISELLDQAPPLRDPKTVISEIGGTDAPDAYLRSLHPRHEQFTRLREALNKARADESAKTRDIRRLIINMERWRWMPEDLAPTFVWLNTPEFMLYLVKDGETIFADKTLVGTIGYATPVFSADLKTIVFNPDWVAPPSVLEDKLWPALKRGYYNILKSNQLRVSYQGKPIDPSKVDWRRVNIHNFTFSQKSGPKNVLGKAKFLYPNKHIVYMHDTLPYRQKVFKETKRAIGYGCVRMENPRRFAELILAEDEQWPASEVKSKVKNLWDNGVDSAVTIDVKLPVHTTYFTATVDKDGKVATFEDLYGLDRAHAAALFGSADGFPKPPPEAKPRETVASSPSRSTGPRNGFASSVGFLGD